MREKKEESLQIFKIQKDKGEMSFENKLIKPWDYYTDPYTHKFGNIDEIDNFIGNYITLEFSRDRPTGQFPRRERKLSKGNCPQKKQQVPRRNTTKPFKAKESQFCINCSKHRKWKWRATFTFFLYSQYNIDTRCC